MTGLGWRGPRRGRGLASPSPRTVRGRGRSEAGRAAARGRSRAHVRPLPSSFPRLRRVDAEREGGGGRPRVAR